MQNPPAAQDPTTPDATDAWHAMDAEAALSRLESAAGGLSPDEAARRLERHGPNALPPPPRRHPVLRFLSQFNNTLIYFLLAASVAAWALSHFVDAGVIVAVVLVNAAIGHVQEGKAERAMEAIGRMLSPRARARRDGHWQELEASALVPGDVVALKAGDLISYYARAVDNSAPSAKSAASACAAWPMGPRGPSRCSPRSCSMRRFPPRRWNGDAPSIWPGLPPRWGAR